MNKYISILLFLIFHLSISAQDITNTLGENGNFRVKGNTGADIQFKVEHDGNVGIHVSDGLELTSSINIGGSFATPIRDVFETSFSFTDADYLVFINQDATGTLPDASSALGRTYIVLRGISTTLTLDSPSPIVGNKVHDNPTTLYSLIYSSGESWFVYDIASSTEKNINPGFVLRVERVNSDFTVSPDVQLYHFYGGNDITVTLPSAEEVKGIVYTMTMIEDQATGVSTNFVLTDPTETINGNTEGSIKNANYIYLYSDGFNWWAFGYSTDPATRELPKTAVANTILLSDFFEQTFLANFSGDNDSYDLTLPPAAENKGKTFTIKRNADGNTFLDNFINIKPSPGEKLDNIDSSSQYVMSNDFELLTIESNGINWMIMNQINH